MSFRFDTRARGRNRLALAAGAILLAGLTGATVASAWTTNGVPVRTGSSEVKGVRVAPDGTGGTFVCWAEKPGADSDIYVARVSSAGTVSWSVAAASLLGEQANPDLVADGSGGVFVAWQDARTPANGSDIYAIHLNSSGARVAGWPLNGLLVHPGNASTWVPVRPCVASDNAGGVVIAWSESYSYISRLVANRLDSGGSILWSSYGTVLYQPANNQLADTDPTIITDPSGNVFVGWSTKSNYSNVGVQKLSIADGSLPWGSTPRWVATSSSNLTGTWPALVSNGSGGVLVACTDEIWTDPNVTVTNLDGAYGGVLWFAYACNAAGSQALPRAVSDDAGGIIVLWQDERSGSAQLYGTRLTSAGSVAPGWTTNGALVGTGLATSITGFRFSVARDGLGGATVAWGNTSNDIKGRRLACAGTMEAEYNLCTDGGTQTAPGIALVAANQAVAAWIDSRTSGVASSGVYAQTLAVAQPTSAALTVVSGSLMQTVSWLEPSSDPQLGAPVQFDLRRSLAPINDANWGSATPVASFAASGTPGTSFCVQSTDLSLCTTYYYALGTSYSCASAKLSTKSAKTKCAGTITITCGARAGQAETEASPDLAFSLSAPFPSPARTSVNFSLTLPRDLEGEALRFDVLDVAGRRVREISTAAARPGLQTLAWDLRDDSGHAVASGVYFARLVVGSRVESRTVVVQP